MTVVGDGGEVDEGSKGDAVTQAVKVAKAAMPPLGHPWVTFMNCGNCSPGGADGSKNSTHPKAEQMIVDIIGRTIYMISTAYLTASPLQNCFE